MSPDQMLLLIISVGILVLSVSFHEFAHAWAAYRLGDRTAYAMGRMTINPIPHIDLFQSIILPAVLYFSTNGMMVFGGAKPVPIVSSNFRHPSRGLMISALAGPLSNLLLAVVAAAAWVAFARLGKAGGGETINDRIFYQMVTMNVLLAAFNLIPIPPLDGSRVLRHFVGWEGKRLMDMLEPYGMLLIILLLAFGVLRAVVVPLYLFLLHLPAWVMRLLGG